MTRSDAFYIAWLLVHKCDSTCAGADHIEDQALLFEAIELRKAGRPVDILRDGRTY